MEAPRRHSPPPHLPDEIVTEIMAWLPVKSLMRFRCVSKSMNSLVSDPNFVKLHLRKSPKHAHVLLSMMQLDDLGVLGGTDLVPYSVNRLMNNSPSTVDEFDRHRLEKGSSICGSVDGLVCLLVSRGEHWVQFWNPATRSVSSRSPILTVDPSIPSLGGPNGAIKAGFGYDRSTETYKVVAIVYTWRTKQNEFIVHNKGDSCWRKIGSCSNLYFLKNEDDGKFVSDTLNWLAIRVSGDALHVSELVIVSFDLRKETYSELMVPEGRQEFMIPAGSDTFPQREPKLLVLRDYLCLFHDYMGSYFVLWQMRDFGNPKSWRPLMNVSHDVSHDSHILPRSWTWYFVFEAGDCVMIASPSLKDVIAYSWSDNTAEYIEIPTDQYWLNAKRYVPTLVSPH